MRAALFVVARVDGAVMQVSTIDRFGRDADPGLAGVCVGPKQVLTAAELGARAATASAPIISALLSSALGLADADSFDAFILWPVTDSAYAATPIASAFLALAVRLAALARLADLAWIAAASPAHCDARYALAGAASTFLIRGAFPAAAAAAIFATLLAGTGWNVRVQRLAIGLVRVTIVVVVGVEAVSHAIIIGIRETLVDQLVAVVVDSVADFHSQVLAGPLFAFAHADTWLLAGRPILLRRMSAGPQGKTIVVGARVPVIAVSALAPAPVASALLPVAFRQAALVSVADFPGSAAGITTRCNLGETLAQAAVRALLVRTALPTRAIASVRTTFLALAVGQTVLAAEDSQNSGSQPG